MAMDLEQLIQVRVPQDENWIKTGVLGGERPWAYPLAGSSRIGVGLLVNKTLADYLSAYDYIAWAEPHPTVLPQVVSVYENPYLPKTNPVFLDETSIDIWFDEYFEVLRETAFDIFQSDDLAAHYKKLRPLLEKSIPRCNRCGQVWSVWMTDDRLWEKVAGKRWGDKHLCWYCFLALHAKKKVREEPFMTLGFDWGSEVEV